MVQIAEPKSLPYDPEGLSRDILNFVKDLEDGEKFKLIKQNPWQYLKKGSFPILYSYISNSNATRNSFVGFMKRFLSGINVFNACSRCIVIVYLTILSLLGQVSIWIGGLNEIIDKVVDILRDFFGEAILLGRLSDLFERVNRRMSLRHLAQIICRDLNLCPTN